MPPAGALWLWDEGGLIVPPAIDPGKPSRPGHPRPDRSSSRALHLDPGGLARSLAGGSTADGMISRPGVRKSAALTLRIHTAV